MPSKDVARQLGPWLPVISSLGALERLVPDAVAEDVARQLGPWLLVMSSLGAREWLVR